MFQNAKKISEFPTFKSPYPFLQPSERGYLLRERFLETTISRIVKQNLSSPSANIAIRRLLFVLSFVFLFSPPGWRGGGGDRRNGVLARFHLR